MSSGCGVRKPAETRVTWSCQIPLTEGLVPGGSEVGRADTRSRSTPQSAGDPELSASQSGGDPELSASQSAGDPELSASPHHNHASLNHRPSTQQPPIYAQILQDQALLESITERGELPQQEAELHDRGDVCLSQQQHARNHQRSIENQAPAAAERVLSGQGGGRLNHSPAGGRQAQSETRSARERAPGDYNTDTTDNTDNTDRTDCRQVSTHCYNIGPCDGKVSLDRQKRETFPDNRQLNSSRHKGDLPEKEERAEKEGLRESVLGARSWVRSQEKGEESDKMCDCERGDLHLSGTARVPERSPGSLARGSVEVSVNQGSRAVEVSENQGSRAVEVSVNQGSRVVEVSGNQGSRVVEVSGNSETATVFTPLTVDTQSHTGQFPSEDETELAEMLASYYTGAPLHYLPVYRPVTMTTKLPQTQSPCISKKRALEEEAASIPQKLVKMCLQ